MKITIGQLRRIIREAVFDPSSMPVIKDDRTEDQKNAQRLQTQALRGPPPGDMHPEEVQMLKRYRREWRELQKRVLDPDDPMNQGESSFDPADVGTEWEHKYVSELTDPYELRLGIQKRMGDLLGKMKDIFNFHENGW